MASYNTRTTLRRSALAVALGVCFAGAVQAQTNTAGAVAGRASSGDTITVTNPATGFTRTITVDSSGTYRFSQLPTGQYTVTRNGGNERTVTVNVGTAANVDYVAGSSAGSLDTVTVIGTGAISPIDVRSVESTTVLTSEQIAKIPVARDTTSVALLAPGTVRGDNAFGNLASFGGASVAENQYFINGFNVTNTFRGLNFSTVPFEGIAEQQTKTGGYGAEFGRALGGVVNQITKRGTNDFKAGFSAYWSPDSLRSADRNTFLSNPLACGPAPYNTCSAGRLRADNSKDTEGQWNANVWAGGALIQNRLFAYGLLSYRRADSDSWGSVVSRTNNSSESKTPGWLLKLDWEISDNHRLEFTGFSDKRKTETATYLNNIGQLDRLGLVGTSYSEQGGQNLILKYTGYLTDNFTLSALAGRGTFSRGLYLRTASGVDVRYGGILSQPATGCPGIVDARPVSRQQATGVYSSPCNITGGGSIPRADSEDTRKQYRVDAEWQLSRHLVRFGVDVDNYSSIAGTSYEGGRIWRYSTLATGQDIVREQIVNQGSVNDVRQRAYYIEDTWNVVDNLNLYIGGRWDTFDNRDGFGNTFLKINNQFGARLGFAWDVFGDSTFKVFGNAGRYSLALTSDVATRGASASVFTRQNFNFTSVDPATGAPRGLTPRGGLTYINGEFGAPKNPATIADQNLKPMYQDEFILGFQKSLSNNVTLGVKGVYRSLKAAIDDNCDYTAIMEAGGFTYNSASHAWVNSQGRAAVLPNAGFPYCRMFNPGADAVFMTDFFADGTLTPVKVPGARLSPVAKRNYSAMEFFIDGSWDRMMLHASYTYSAGRGNTEGGVKSDIGQANTNVTQDFDYIELTKDTYGYLPNDRRHTLKIFGNYEFSDEWSLGANVLVQSGRPLNCIGVLYPYHGGYHPYGSSFMRCGTSPAGQSNTGGVLNGPVQAFPRGTKGRLPWSSNLDLNLAYTPNWAKGLMFKVDVFNVLNKQQVISVVETAEDAATGLPSDTYLLPASWQSPRSVRFMVQYQF